MKYSRVFPVSIGLMYALIGIIFALSGCDDNRVDPSVYNPRDISAAYKMPDGAENCKVFYVIGQGSNYNLHMITCDGKSTVTTTKIGSKGARTITIKIGDVEYEATPKETK